MVYRVQICNMFWHAFLSFGGFPLKMSVYSTAATRRLMVCEFYTYLTGVFKWILMQPSDHISRVYPACHSRQTTCCSHSSSFWILQDFTPGNILLTHHSRSPLLVCAGVRLMHYSFFLRLSGIRDSMPSNICQSRRF